MKGLLAVILLCPSFVHADWQEPELSHDLTKVNKKISAPEFSLQNLDEENVELKDYQGKVIMLNFWATWCPPCVREMPSMERLQQKIGGESFKVVAINQMEDFDQVFAFTGQLEVDPTFDILFDSDSEVSHDYNVRGLPTTYIIDKKGQIRYRAIGGRLFDHDEVVSKIEALIKE